MPGYFSHPAFIVGMIFIVISIEAAHTAYRKYSTPCNKLDKCKVDVSGSITYNGYHISSSKCSGKPLSEYDCMWLDPIDACPSPYQCNTTKYEAYVGVSLFLVVMGLLFMFIAFVTHESVSR